MILIFDTYGGLTNQFFDIFYSINFCLKYNIHFTFRYCSLRNDDLISWTESPFEELYDLSFLDKYELYINYYNIKDKLTNDNCYNLNDKILSWTKINNNNNNNNILEQLLELNKEYVVLKQFGGVNHHYYTFQDGNIIDYLYPSRDIMKKYVEIKNKIIGNEPYNFIHYRYEKDFTDAYKINDIKNLDNLIDNIRFKNNNLKIYIACSGDINNLIDLNKYNNLIYKNDDVELNFEQKAFIDYMFGLNSVECYGNKKSSFSGVINIKKQTNNYYA
jgi:hypothetical protein